jgi:hypothetical protein
MRYIPRSFGFFVVTAVVYALQMIPVIGIFMMFMLAMFWSVLLINAGMIGIAVEALTDRVSRWWLILPLAFYGGYLSFAIVDHAALSELRAQYDAANARVSVPFDPERQVLVFEGDGNGGSEYVQNYALPVAYSRNANHPEGFRSNRMMARDVCAKVRGNPALNAAGIWTFGFHDGDAIASRKMETRFCDLGMPERPSLPLVTVARHEEQIRFRSLPITRITTTVTTPDERRYKLRGGVAAPLSWLPMPVMGCALNSGGPSWECAIQFWRNGFTPIVAGKTRYSRDAFTLARALGLRPVAIGERQGGDASVVEAKMVAVEEATLVRQLAAVDRMIADPIAKVEDWDTGVIANRAEVLSAKADAIMTGLERAAAVGGDDYWKARESGRILARLVAKLPDDQFAGYGPRLIALYRATRDNGGSNSVRRETHWLWQSESLRSRVRLLESADL